MKYLTEIRVEPDASFNPEEAIFVFYDAADPPEGGAAAFFDEQPNTFRGGGSFVFGADRRVQLFMTKSDHEWLDGAASTILEYVNANAHLEMILKTRSNADRFTIVELLDNKGAASVIPKLRGNTPRTAGCSRWRQRMMTAHPNARVITIHRHRDRLEASDALSKGDVAAAKEWIASYQPVDRIG